MHREIHCSHMAKLVEMKIQIQELLVLSRKQTRITRCTAVMRHTHWSSFAQTKCNKLRTPAQIESTMQYKLLPYHTARSHRTINKINNAKTRREAFMHSH
jgi:hypothetical protein